MASEGVSIPFGDIPAGSYIRGKRYWIGGGPPPDMPTEEETRARLLATDDAMRYLGTHGTTYKPPSRSGSLSIDVLEFLWGLPYNNLTLAYIHGLQPSCIRATYGETKTDAWPQRVTVYLSKDNTVERITQEVSLGYACGHEVHLALLAIKAAAAGAGNEDALARIQLEEKHE